ncbi:hypothetical protein LUZ60_004607 [Juncus effusus]|nr:hypothetical protein LUZ60_004607 [Juncus effusus]
MGRGVSSGGGQSSLGYLFGTGEATKPKQSSRVEESSPVPQSSPVDNSKQIPAGIQYSGSPTNNYFRADGQNTGNFLTDRPSTKVHAAPGGGSSLGYLFGGSEKAPSESK